MTSIVNNKKIAVNTIFLYARMIVVMAVSLYTVRAVLHQLGAVDYGIYNVVGGVVAMFSFLNSTLTTSSQRYFSVELAKGDKKRLNQWFCLNVTTFSFFIFIFIVIAETVGLWFVNTQMQIPDERMFAANVVYQLSIISFCIHFFNVPYNALIIAHERMSTFAYISIIEVMLKLAIVFALSISPWDKLIVYGVLIFLVSCSITSSYIIYNLRHFEESRIHFYWNKKEMKELMGFSGWHFLGTFSVVVRSQGINILINMFFNPAVNAARAIAYQIYVAVNQLSHNFFVAVKPQIYKSYAVGDYNSLYSLIIRSTAMCSFLVSVLVYPILINTRFVLDFWLKEVPEYAVVFTQLVLLNGLIDSTNGPTAAAALATGKIKNYELLVATTILLNLPVSYVALKLGAEPTSTIVVSIIISLLTTFARAYMVHKMIGFPLLKYGVMFIKITIASSLVWAIMFFTIQNNELTFLKLIVESVFLIILLTVSYISIVFERNDVKHVYELVKKKLTR